MLPRLSLGLFGVPLLILTPLGELMWEDLQSLALWRMNTSSAPSAQH
jgi:hypothetical protein